MTLDEYRKACIEAMEMAYEAQRRKDGHKLSTFYKIKAMTAALDAIPAVSARVVPAEATEQMLQTGSEKFAETGLWAQLWRAMAAAGDLTNPPEKKP
jgi:hypothetical protein